jgi:hypothetical protein
MLVLLFVWVYLFFFGLDFKRDVRKSFKRFKVITAILLVLVIIVFSFRRFSYPNSDNQSQDLKGKLQFRIKNVTTHMIYRYLTIININKSFNSLYNDLWINNVPFYAKTDFDEYALGKKEFNLIYNGDFRYGLRFWSPDANQTIHELVTTPYGNGVRVSRLNGDNWNWSLRYTGKDIVFYAHHTYSFHFKFKVLNGGGIPFKIGFGTIDSKNWSDNSAYLPLNIKSLEDGWKEAECSYTFKRSHFGIPIFMNSQLDSTIIEFADISLIESDKFDSYPKYSDEISDNANVIIKYLSATDSIIQNKYFSNFKSNLFYNGDFNLGNLFWIPYADATEHRIVKTPFGNGIRISRADGNGADWPLRYDGRPIIYYEGHKYQLSFYFKVIKGNSLPFNVGYWVNDGSGYGSAISLPVTLHPLKQGWLHAVYTYRFKSTQYDLPTFLNSVPDSSIIEIANIELIDLDRIDTLQAFLDQDKNVETKAQDFKFVNVDYRNYKNSFYSPRINRWNFSMAIFLDSLSLKEKIFGGGFNYMKMMGTEFGEVKYDDPHNPFISSFLYSGIIGGLTYLWFIILVIFYYIKYYKYHIYYFYSFLVVFLFSFVSANTHFSIPIYSILCIIPFLSRYIVESENLKTQKQINNPNI